MRVSLTSGVKSEFRVMTKGKCNCGAVSFEVKRELSDIFVCHCSICRSSTGSMGIAVCIVSKEDFSWLQGEGNIRTWSKPGHDWQTSFCEVCGSPVPGKNDEDNMYIPASLITSDTSNLSVTHHLYVGSKASWEEIAGSGKHHVAGYSG